MDRTFYPGSEPASLHSKLRNGSAIPQTCCCEATEAADGACQMDCYRPPDAESCCGDTAAEAAESLADITALQDTQTADDQIAETSQQQQQEQEQQWQQHSSWGCGSDDREQQQLLQQQQHCSSFDSHGSSQCTAVHMGDDFECLEAQDVSMLVDDESIEYPGGVDAALAEFYSAACSQDQTMSATAAAAVPPSLGLSLHRPVLVIPQLQRQEQQHRHHQHPATHGAAIPSLASLLVSQTPAPCYAANMLPCCQWEAFEGDAVGDVLAGKVPAPSCCSSGGLTGCLLGIGAA